MRPFWDWTPQVVQSKMEGVMTLRWLKLLQHCPGFVSILCGHPILLGCREGARHQELHAILAEYQELCAILFRGGSSMLKQYWPEHSCPVIVGENFLLHGAP